MPRPRVPAGAPVPGSAICVCLVTVALLTPLEQENLYTMDTVLCFFTRVRHPKLCSPAEKALGDRSGSAPPEVPPAWMRESRI